MSLRRCLFPSFRATHPALFFVGFAIAVVQVALSLGLTVLGGVVPSIYAPLLPLASTVVVLLLTLPLAVGIYLPVRERTESVGETLRVATDAVRRYYLRVLASKLAAFGAALGMAIGGTALSLVLHTVVRYGRYATGNPGTPNAWLATWTFPSLFVGFLVAGILVTRFADVSTAFGDATPRAAWRSSAAFARREPLSFLGYAAVVTALLGPSQALPFAFASTEGVAVVVGLVLVVGSVGLVLASALHVTYFERVVEPPGTSASSSSVRWTRVAAVAVVLVAAVAGASYVRTTDLGSGQDEIQSLPDDPHAAYAVAANNTANANRRYVIQRRNESHSDGEYRTTDRAGIDYDDRQIYVYVHGEDVVVGGYMEEGTYATLNSGRATGSLKTLSRDTGNWAVTAAPMYGFVAGSGSNSIPPTTVDWAVASENESTIVYRTDDEDQILEALGPDWHAGATKPLSEDSYAEVYVDRERAIITRLRFHLHSLATGDNFTYVTRYEDVGTADLERPPGIGPREPLEWFWDVLFY